MQLYHFTHPLHVPAIIGSGVLKTTESNVSAERSHAGPDVLWCFDSPEPRSLDCVGAAKSKVRFTIDIPDGWASDWPSWARAHGVKEYWYRALAKSGVSTEWLVVDRPVRRDHWVEAVQRMADLWIPLIELPSAASLASEPSAR